MEKLKKEFGQHYLVEFIDCDSEKIKYVDQVKEAALSATEKSEANIIEHFFHQYKPYGVTGMILISESHFSLHTWPDDHYVAFDVLTCGTMYPQRAIDHLKSAFHAQTIKIKRFSRGY